MIAYLEPSFAEVSFYHSPEGLEYRAQALRPSDEEPITIRTPLIATFDVSDDELDYESDDAHPGLSHHIVDDLGDISSRRISLLSSTPVKPTTIYEQLPKASCSPSNKPSMDNGDVTSPLLSISGNNNSLGYLQNGGSPAVSIPSPTVSSDQPSSLFSNPPLRNSIPLSTTPTSNNYTEASFTSSRIPPSSNYSIPLTPVKVNDLNSKSSQNRPTRSPITYTSVTPVNCSGDKFGNGSTTGGNGFINQLNKTTQF